MDCHLIKDEHPKIHSFMNLIFREYLTLSRLTGVKLEAPSMFVEDTCVISSKIKTFDRIMLQKIKRHFGRLFLDATCLILAFTFGERCRQCQLGRARLEPVNGFTW